MAASALNKNLPPKKQYFIVLLVPISPCLFGQAFDYYVNKYDTQIKRWLRLSTSLWGIPLRCDLFRKRVDPKNFFLWQELLELY